MWRFVRWRLATLTWGRLEEWLVGMRLVLIWVHIPEGPGRSLGPGAVAPRRIAIARTGAGVASLDPARTAVLVILGLSGDGSTAGNGDHAEGDGGDSRLGMHFVRGKCGMWSF
jgi:hypothetical protein